MTLTIRNIAALMALVAAGACTDAGRFGNGAGAAGAGAAGAGAMTAPNPAADPTSPAYFRQTVGDRVLFAVDESTLSPEARSVLEGQAVWLASNPDYQAVIEGHADEQGTREYNLALGARRANSVREFLISRGIAGTRLRTVTFGKERPAELCSEEACYAKNRRAVTIISAGVPVG